MKTACLLMFIQEIQVNRFLRSTSLLISKHQHCTHEKEKLILHHPTTNTFYCFAAKVNKDVSIHIHGGAFMFGSGDRYKPDYLMDHDDIIYVSFNYRLGPLGFLSTGDSIVPGNNGLKDQVAALSWVQRNIVAFGGDPSKVTITGLSAGGASVHYMYLSPLSHGTLKVNLKKKIR